MKKSEISKIDKLMKKNQDDAKEIETFEAILKNMKDLDPQKMHLWLKIYDNATNDRATASALLTQSFALLGQTASEHMSLGPTIVKYLERMSKSNDQMLALAQVVTKEISSAAALNTDDIFSKIEE